MFQNQEDFNSFVIFMCFIGIGALVWLFVYFVKLYNDLVKFRQQVRECWSGIDIELRRRYDLVPNLVSIVQRYAGHELDVFRQVTEARSRALQSTGTPGAQARDELGLVNSLSVLMAVAESYPDLKADTQFMALQEQLTSTEDRLAEARHAYNDKVQALNTLQESFPANILARRFSFKPEQYFEIESRIHRETPKV
jgi:LemA protein